MLCPISHHSCAGQAVILGPDSDSAALLRDGSFSAGPAALSTSGETQRLEHCFTTGEGQRVRIVQHMRAGEVRDNCKMYFTQEGANE
jgi:hypothetical protein